MSQALEKLRLEFLEYLEIEKGRSLKTVATYDRHIQYFFRQSGVKTPADITETVVRKFRLHLNKKTVPTQKGVYGAASTLKKKTQNYYLVALRVFLMWLGRREIESLDPSKIELAKVPERSIDILTAAELDRLREAPLKQYHARKKPTTKDKITAYRDTAVLEMLFSTGLRVSELCSLPRELDLSQGEFSIRGKGEKIRVVFLSDTAKKALIEYLDIRQDVSAALFAPLSHPTGGIKGSASARMTPRSMQRIIRDCATYCGISSKVTPHILRHSFATDLLRNGADIRSVQALLGHAHIATTQVYTHVTDSELRQVHKKFHRQ